MQIEEELEKFVSYYYKDKDQMHDLSHIKRVLNVALKLNENYGFPPNKIMYGVFFHGMISKYEDNIRNYLLSNGKSKSFIEEIIEITKASSNNAIPQSLGGSILHDAHIIEGGKTFLITKSLITGTSRNQSLLETLNYIENNIIGKFKCSLPESKKTYREMEQFAIDFIKDLRNNL